MKTPMQEFIDWLNIYSDNVIDKSMVIYKAELMLQKEQQVMCEFAIDYTMQTKPAYDFHRAKFNNEL